METGKGRGALGTRPQLRAALDPCKRKKATLLIAKLDRLARNVHFVSGLMESGADFVAADMPQANKLPIHVLAAVAEAEAEAISTRTKAALAAAKARGVKLGVAGPANLRHVKIDHKAEADARVEQLHSTRLGLRSQGLTHRAMVVELNRHGVKTARGGQWHLPTVQRMLACLDRNA